jgi:hypothetical protein
MAKKSDPSPAEMARLAGMSDEAVRAKTGATWEQWVRVLDAIDAPRMSHREIAAHLRQEHGLSGWWSQGVTVGYERIRGLRAVGQRRGGTYDANKSKTFAVPLSRLYRAFGTRGMRERWLAVEGMSVRTSRVERSMRLSWPDGTSVQAYFTAKGPGKSQVAIQHSGLRDETEVGRRKEFWAERLSALSALLATAGSRGTAAVRRARRPTRR